MDNGQGLCDGRTGTGWKARLGRIRELATQISAATPYRDLGLIPNPKAREEQVQEVERRIGCRLPTSYREFLKCHDGWPRFYEGASLLSTRELGLARQTALVSAAARVQPSGPPTQKSFVIFGIDPQETTLFAFNTRRRYPDGEYEIIGWLNELGLRWRGFEQFLCGIEELYEAQLGAQWPELRSA